MIFSRSERFWRLLLRLAALLRDAANHETEPIGFFFFFAALPWVATGNVVFLKGTSIETSFKGHMYIRWNHHRVTAGPPWEYCSCIWVLYHILRWKGREELVVGVYAVVKVRGELGEYFTQRNEVTTIELRTSKDTNLELGLSQCFFFFFFFFAIHGVAVPHQAVHSYYIVSSHFRKYPCKCLFFNKALHKIHFSLSFLLTQSRSTQSVDGGSLIWCPWDVETSLLLF